MTHYVFKNFIFLGSLVLILFILSSCNNKDIALNENNQILQNSNPIETPTKAEEYAETMDSASNEENTQELGYSLIYKNSEYYIEFPVNTVHGTQDNLDPIPIICFDDAKSFIDTVKNSNYTDEQLKELSKFPNEDGKIKVCDLDNIYYPTLNGESFEEGSLGWYGDYYDWVIKFDKNNDVEAFISIKFNDEYLNEEDFVQRIRSARNVFKDEILDNGVESIYYGPQLEATHRLVKYTLFKDNKQFVILRCYSLTCVDNNLDEPEYTETLSGIKMYCYEESISYNVFFDFSEYDITDETLMTFSMQKYVEPENTVE